MAMTNKAKASQLVMNSFFVAQAAKILATTLSLIIIRYNYISVNAVN